MMPSSVVGRDSFTQVAPARCETERRRDGGKGIGSLSRSRRSSVALVGLRRPLVAMFDQSLVSGASFLTAVMVGRIAGEQQLGLYSLGFTLLILACGAQESLVLIPYTVFATRTDDERRRQFAGSTLLQSALGSLAMGLCLATGGFALAAMAGIPQIVPIVAVLLITAPMMLLREFGRRLAFAHLRLGWALAIDGAVAASQLTLLVCLSLSGRLSAVAALAVLAVSCGVVSLVWLWSCRGQFVFTRAAFGGDWQRNWSLGRWLLAGHVTGITQAYALHWLLAVVLGTAATGDFAAVTTIVSLANPLVIGLGNFLMPATAHAFAGSGAAGVWKLATRSTLWLAAALVPFCLLAAFAGDWALTALYGARFGGQTPTISLLALAVSAAALGVGAEHALRSMDRPRAIFVANLSALTITLALAGWLVPAHRTVGAACSLLAGNVVGGLVRWWALRFSISDFGFSIAVHHQSKIQNPKSKMAGKDGSDAQ